MKSLYRSRQFSRQSKSKGFTLIEVMIALVILGVGLLAFALLQTMNVRFTKSAQQRTIASNLAYEIIDVMRVQRGMGSYFHGISYDSFSSVTADGCKIKTDSGPAANIARWKCQVKTSLPDGVAKVDLSENGEVSVTVKWGDGTWETDVTKQVTAFSVQSRI